jgi:hypothetical protein
VVDINDLYGKNLGSFDKEGDEKQQNTNPNPNTKQKSQEKKEKPLSVLEMKRKLEGHVTGYGKLVGFSEQYVVVSRTIAVCKGEVSCACDASDSMHTRPCGYNVDTKHNPPIPIIISIFDTGNGKPLVCPRCKGIDFEVKMERRIAKLVILDDANNSSSNVHQHVILYDDMVENVTPGDVEIGGEMFVEMRAGSNKNSKMDNVLHATSIRYLKKREVVNTPEDIRNFYKWKQLCDKMAECPACLEWAKREHIHPFKKTPMYTPVTFNERLVEMFAPNVVGHRVAKQGLLRSIVGGIRRGDGPLSGKIHTFMLGVKGTAKSKLCKETTRIKLNSGLVSGTHAWPACRPPALELFNIFVNLINS